VGGTKVRNERLAEAMARMRMSSADLATVAEVDPRTIDRWVADWSRIPRAESRHALAETLQVPAGMLWPNAATGPQVTDELLALYPSRAATPVGLVTSLLADATEKIDVLVLAGVWLWDAVPGFAATLGGKSRAGVAVRVCLGDPAGETVRTRGAEEGIDDLLSARCRLAWTYAQRVFADCPGSLRLHDTTLYASILRFDDDLLVNWHLFGAAAADSPVLHLRCTATRGLAASVVASFERVWDGAHSPREETSTDTQALQAAP
jgi:hypothetical protein